eukprot:291778-Prorocentrum_minimum.AAC.2
MPASACAFRARANRTRRGRIYPGHEPITCVERECTRGTSQSRASRENVPGARANHVRRERMYPRHEPTACVERECTRGTSQSRASRENVPGARANRSCGEREYRPKFTRARR